MMFTKEQSKQILEWIGRLIVAVITFLLYQVQSTLHTMSDSLFEMKIMIATAGKDFESLRNEFNEHKASVNAKFENYDANIKDVYKLYKLEQK